MVAEMKGKWLFNFTSLVHHNKHNLSNRSRTLTLSLHDKILTIFRGCNRCEVSALFHENCRFKNSHRTNSVRTTHFNANITQPTAI